MVGSLCFSLELTHSYTPCGQAAHLAKLLVHQLRKLNPRGCCCPSGQKTAAAGPQAEPDDVTPAAASPERLLPPLVQHHRMHGRVGNRPHPTLIISAALALQCGLRAAPCTPVLAEETAVSATAAAAVPGAHENGPGLEHLISCQY